MYKLGILGIGNMGGSILEGVLKASLYKKEDVFLYDPNTEIKEKYCKLGLCFAKDEKDLIENVEMLLLAIKPQMLDELKKYRFENNNLLIISIVAGKTKQKIKKSLGKTPIKG
jgi:pyrroline-5-carboxylate reductase